MSNGNLKIEHTGSQRGHGRYGPRTHVISGTGRPLLVERINNTDLFNAIEVRTKKLMGLPHDNVVKVFGASRSDDGMYIEVFTEMTSEVPVRDALQKMGKLDALVVRNYARQLLNGLKFLHDHEIYMGGLKHEDVLLAGRGKVKISNAHTARVECDEATAGTQGGKSKNTEAMKEDMSSLGIIISDLLKCVIDTPLPPTPPRPGHTSARLGNSGSNTFRAPPFEPRAFLLLCNQSSSAGELLAHSFCGPLPNWREQRRRLLPTARNRPIQPPSPQQSHKGSRPPPLTSSRQARNALGSSRQPLTPGGRLTPKSFQGNRPPRARFPPTPRGQNSARPSGMVANITQKDGPSPKVPEPQKVHMASDELNTTTKSDSSGASDPKDAVAAATAKHRAAIGLDPLTKRTPAQKHFLSILSSSHSPSASNTSSETSQQQHGNDPPRGGASSYREKKAAGLAIMHERRRMNEVISNVVKLDHDLSNGPTTIPPLRLSALAPKPILRSYNLIGDTQISSSDEDSLDDGDIAEVGDLDELL